MRGPTESRIDSIRKALVALRRSGGNTGNSILLSNIAEAFLMVGDLKGAESALQDGFAFVEQSGERYWLADLHRLSGQVALMQTEADRQRAAACFSKAIEVAKGQQARLLELRATTDLARLWQGCRKDGDIRGLLEPVLAMIEGGETVRDVREARALLAELG
jgi:predicted ATPase